MKRTHLRKESEIKVGMHHVTIAESTENAIPSKKNSQKHVVIVPIDVHHRHDSQVSQILNPDKASDITKAQQKNLEGKKTPAKRMREYRARKKVRIQSTSDSPSVVHHQNDGILQTDDNLNKSHAFVGLPCQDINATCKKHQLSVCEITEPGKNLPSID
ncbi:hypothetical protein TNCT_188571 [Trichonephila clavata]|uniref:Uncharacterized protein n=1 Tax=Trichonephila clavata TaxID=2740835 RepID=A0A8X6GM81_TRICU|nr:hypothetical protein TNCT_188571 [Trichonephila clavata]